MKAQELRKPTYWNKLTSEEKNEWRKIYGVKASVPSEEPSRAAVPVFLLVAGIILMIVAALTFAGIGITETSDTRSELAYQRTAEQRERARLSYIYGQIKDSLSERLVSPASASWPDLKDVEIRDDLQPVWSGWVDSENRAGALVRSDWRVTLELYPISFDLEKGEPIGHTLVYINELNSR